MEVDHTIKRAMDWGIPVVALLVLIALLAVMSARGEKHATDAHPDEASATARSYSRPHPRLLDAASHGAYHQMGGSPLLLWGVATSLTRGRRRPASGR